ncbi:hypothetical protein ACFPMF_08425 [Larkinella bovis]|uniref:Lipocalin-like domain-containing protein n=1 Tax=Larkinella bovis TaxID=683041 RepID=A0ABW0IDC7_9BACT
MKSLGNWLLILLAIGFVQASRVSPDQVTFRATSPCDRIPRSMLSIPTTTECEMIQWNLALYRDPRNQNPTVYKLHYTYGMSKPSTTGFQDGMGSGTKEGNWSMQQEGKNKTFYRLEPSASAPAISFVRLDDNLLHLLDPDGKLMIGHAGWSYTLNRK